MADRFDKFSEPARQTLTLAQVASQELGHEHIDTGHLLLGLLRLAHPPIESLLDGTEADAIRAHVEASAEDSLRQLGGAMGLTPDGKRMIELAVEAARRSGTFDINAEYLLLGILQQPDCVGSAALAAAGTDVPALAAELERRLFEEAPIGAPALTATEAIDRARRVLDGRGRTQLIPDSDARSLVIERLVDARKTVEASEIGYAKLIGTELLLPELLFITDALESGVSTLPEFLERVGEVRHARASLERLARLYQRADQRQLSAAASEAAAALQVASPLL